MISGKDCTIINLSKGAVTTPLLVVSQEFIDELNWGNEPRVARLIPLSTIL